MASIGWMFGWQRRTESSQAVLFFDSDIQSPFLLQSLRQPGSCMYKPCHTSPRLTRQANTTTQGHTVIDISTHTENRDSRLPQKNTSRFMRKRHVRSKGQYICTQAATLSSSCAEQLLPGSLLVLLIVSTANYRS